MPYCDFMRSRRSRAAAFEYETRDARSTRIGSTTWSTTEAMTESGSASGAATEGFNTMKSKIWIVAVSEFTTLVQSKAFVVGLLMMPVFSGIAIGMARFTKDATDIKDRRFAV